jgi:hypothetical protein
LRRSRTARDDRLGDFDAGVVHQHVKPAECIYGGRYRVGNVDVRTDIATHTNASVAEFCCCGIRPLPVDISDGDPGAAVDKSTRNGQADAVSRTRHDHSPSHEIVNCGVSYLDEFPVRKASKSFRRMQCLRAVKRIQAMRTQRRPHPTNAGRADAL